MVRKPAPCRESTFQSTGSLQPACQGAPCGLSMFSLLLTWLELKETRDLHMGSPCVTSGSSFFRGPGQAGRDEVCSAVESIQASAN